MAQLSQLGQLNTTALVVPDLYVQIVPPQNIVPNGVPTNVLGLVGTATWGPVNQAAVVGNSQSMTQMFGPPQVRKYDVGTAQQIAAQQGAANFRIVRVTDGTDLAASAVIAGVSGAGFLLTARYTGSLGNSVTWALTAGSAVGTFKLTILAAPLGISEVFDRIGGTGAAFWTNLATALASGAGPLRGPSQLVVGTVSGAYATAPTVNATPAALSGGSDGATTITAATLVGSDSATPRTGMYALRGQGCGVAMLADADDSTQWVTQGAFGLSEAVYMVVTSPAGSAITNGTTGTVDLKLAAGLDSYAVKLMHGDWLYWQDQVNAVTRLVSPQPFAAGLLANLSPERSSLNKPLYGVIGSQKSGLPGSGLAGTYAAADLQALLQAGVDVIAKPAPGGSYWTVRGGLNSSSNAATNGDNYTRLTDYIATSIAATFGQFVGQVITATLFQQVKSALLAFFGNMAAAGQLSSPDGSTPYGVVCDISNNIPTRTSLGYLQADCQCVFGPIAKFVLANVEGGQTVQVKRQVTGGGTTVTN